MTITDDLQMKIRLSAKLKKRIEDAARVNRRTLNGEIAARLADSFLTDERSKAAAKKLLLMGPHRDQRLDEIEDRIAKLEAKK